MDQTQTPQDLKYFCQDNSSAKKKLGFIASYPEKCPDWIEKIILIIEYFQLLSQAFLVFPEIITSFGAHHSRQLFIVVLSFMKIFNPSCLLTYSDSNQLVFNILILIIIFTLVKYACIGMIIYVVASKRFEPSPTLKILWKWICKLQARLVYFLITSFWIEALIYISKGDFTFAGSNKPWNVAFLSTLIVIEYLLSIILETQLCYLLPSKNLLSNKSSDIQILTLTQKLILQIVYAAFRENSKAFIWVFSVLSLSFCAVRSLIFYTTLPLYNHKSLRMQSDLLSLTSVSSIVCFIQAILWTADYSQFNHNFYILTWIVLSILLIRISRGYLQNLIMTLLLGNRKSFSKLKPELQIHKIYCSQQLQKEQFLPHEMNISYDLKHLITNTDKIESPIEFLEGLIVKFPHHSFLNLHIAYFCTKHPDLHAKAIKVLANVKQITWSKLYLTTSFLYYKIQKSFIAKITNNKDELLDLSTFLKNILNLEELKREMLQQTQLTVQICQEILNEVSDIGKIFNHAQKIHKHRTKIEKRFLQLSHHLPEGFLEPHLLYAESQLALNFSIWNHKKFLDKYFTKFARSQRYFKDPNLTQENLYQSTNTFLLVSSGHNNTSNKADNGQILFCTKSAEQLCGVPKSSLYRSQISSLFLPYLQTFFADFFKNLQVGKAFNNAFIYNKNGGYVTEVNLFVNFHPYITENLYLNIMIRPVLDPEECLLIRENGDIEGATESLAQKFNLKSHSTNIITLSEELAELNEAINLLKAAGVINIPEKIYESNVKESLEVKRSLSKKKRITSQTISFDRALEIYNSFSTATRKVLISDLNLEPIYFNCKVSFIQVGSIFLKRLYLTPTSKNSLLIEESAKTGFGSENLNNCQEVTPHGEFITQRNDLTSSRNLLGTHRDIKRHASESSRAQRTFQQQAESIKSDSSLYGGRSVQRRTFATFNRAVATKSDPHKFKTLCGAFFILILLILCCQVIMKVISEKTIKNLETKKQVLNSAQTRTFYVVKIEADARALTILLSGALGVGQAGSASFDPEELLALTKSNLDIIVQADENIRKNINLMNDKIKKELFLQDIRLIGSYNDLTNMDSQNITTFQAIDTLQTALSKVYALPTIYSPQGYQIFAFIVQNTINDIVYKNNVMNNEFIQSLNQEKDDLNFVTKLCLILVPIILFSIYAVLCYLIWTQYLMKITNLLAFVKLDPNRVRALMQNLNRFTDFLNDKELPLMVETEGGEKTRFTLKRHRTGATTQSNTINLSQIRKRYYKFICLITICVFVLFSIILANFIATSNSTNIIYKKQKQLQFTNQLSVECFIGYISMVELFVSNDTNSIQHLSPQQSLINALDKIDSYQEEMNSIFSDGGDYDPEISTLLFKSNDCSELTSVFQFYCAILLETGQSATLVQTLSLLRSVLKTSLSNFQTANRSTLASLLAAGLRNYQTVATAANVVAGKSRLISKVLDVQLSESIADTNSQLSAILANFIVGLVIAVIFIWHQVLMKIKEANNDFKKVLKTFPPDLVLSSFLLKTFLRNNSQGVFDL